MSRVPVIQFDHVWKQYHVGLRHHRLSDALPGLLRRRGRDDAQDGTFWALEDVSFHVEKGETLGIIGRNGAGKSTALKLLSGITKQTKGAIHVDGKLAALIEVGAGFHPDLTGRENIFLNGTILGLKRQEIKALFDQIVAFAEVERFVDTPVKRYSSGMYVRLGFAIAVHVNPDVLLIDEVLSVGDLAFQQKCLERIYELKQAGTTIIFISHNLNAVQRICDRVLLLSQGKAVLEGDPATVIREYRGQIVQKERERFAQQSARQARDSSGSRKAAIESIRIFAPTGQATETVETGQPMVVEIAYRCVQRIERPRVKVSIHRLDGVICHVATLRSDGRSGVPPMDGQNRLRLAYGSVQLLPNTYRVSVELGEEGRAVPFDSREDGSFFTVTSSRHQDATGIVPLEFRLDVSQETG